MLIKNILCTYPIPYTYCHPQIPSNKHKNTVNQLTSYSKNTLSHIINLQTEMLKLRRMNMLKQVKIRHLNTTLPRKRVRSNFKHAGNHQQDEELGELLCSLWVMTLEASNLKMLVQVKTGLEEKCFYHFICISRFSTTGHGTLERPQYC